MNLYFFDCDKTLYDFDFRKRLPMMAQLTGTSQYRLASTWWAGGHERAAEAGEYATSDEYFDAFQEITGAALTLEKYQIARKAAMTPIRGSIAALQRAATTGTVAMLSNNPVPFFDSLTVLTPEILHLVEDRAFISATLGVRKPDPLLFTRALEKCDTQPEDAFFVDDSASNVAGARAVGMHAFQLNRLGDTFDFTGLNNAIDSFLSRNGS